jgi:Ca-activated chloride channel family protein
MVRPQWGEGTEKFKASGIDIAVAFDLSGSMLAEDFQLEGKRANRAAVAKAVLKGFINDRPADRIGLVAFAGRAYIAAPLTLDHDFLLANLDRLEAGSEAIEDGTAIGSAISAGLNRLRDLDSESRIIILMTDGQNNSGTVAPMTAAEAAELLGVKVYTIGVGTRGTAPMPYTDVFGRKRSRNVEVNIDEKTLQKIAEQTGGQYFRADSQSKLREIYEKIDEMEKTEVEVERFFNYDEFFPYIVIAGLALLLLELILANTVWLKLP